MTAARNTKAYNFVDSFREPGVGADWVTLPQFFKDAANYTVVGTGKVFHKGLPPNWDLAYSWDRRMSDGTWEGWMYPSEPRCPKETVWCAVEDGDGDDDDLFDDTQITRKALALLDNITKVDGGQRPWFLAVGYRKPHVQWRFPSRFLAAIPSASVTEPKHPLFPAGAPAVAFHQPQNDFLEPFSDVRSCAAAAGGMAPNTSFSAGCQIDFRRAYHASVSFMDAQVGALLDALDSRGLSGNTVVAFFGDHGWQLGEWAEWEKFTNFELAARVPCFMRAPWLANVSSSSTSSPSLAPSASSSASSSPGSSGGHVIRDLVELVDVMPSLIDLALPAGSAAPPAGLEGKSLLPLMLAAAGLQPKPPKQQQQQQQRQQQQQQQQAVALSQFPRCCKAGRPLWEGNDCDDVPRSQFTHMGLSVRTDRYRYTRWLAWDGKTLQPDWEADDAGTELYDHAGDDGLSMDAPFEATNLAGSASPQVIAELEKLLRASFYPPRTTNKTTTTTTTTTTMTTTTTTTTKTLMLAPQNGTSWAFYQGSYGCGSDEGQGCENCSLARAEKACAGWKAMYVDAPPGKPLVPGHGYSYSCCNQMYGPTGAGPTEKNMLDDVTKEPLMQRKDDTAEALKKRLKGYHAQTVPILGHYEPRGVVARVNANQKMAKVAAEVDEIILDLIDKEEQAAADKKLAMGGAGIMKKAAGGGGGLEGFLNRFLCCTLE
eukprot:g4114.t1